eukprot:Ihof_evm1s831 gene=Ihof_evmTU1s831
MEVKGQEKVVGINDTTAAKGKDKELLYTNKIVDGAKRKGKKWNNVAGKQQKDQQTQGEGEGEEGIGRQDRTYDNNLIVRKERVRREVVIGKERNRGRREVEKEEKEKKGEVKELVEEVSRIHIRGEGEGREANVRKGRGKEREGEGEERYSSVRRGKGRGREGGKEDSDSSAGRGRRRGREGQREERASNVGKGRGGGREGEGEERNSSVGKARGRERVEEGGQRDNNVRQGRGRGRGREGRKRKGDGEWEERNGSVGKAMGTIREREGKDRDSVVWRGGGRGRYWVKGEEIGKDGIKDGMDNIQKVTTNSPIIDENNTAQTTQRPMRDKSVVNNAQLKARKQLGYLAKQAKYHLECNHFMRVKRLYDEIFGMMKSEPLVHDTTITNEMKFDWYCNQASALLYLQKYEQAYKDATQAHTLYPENINAMFNLGKAAMYIHQLDTAKIYLTQVQMMLPTYKYIDSETLLEAGRMCLDIELHALDEARAKQQAKAKGRQEQVSRTCLYIRKIISTADRNGTPMFAEGDIRALYRHIYTALTGRNCEAFIHNYSLLLADLLKNKEYRRFIMVCTEGVQAVIIGWEVAK